MSTHARLFRNGGSQAVRLPKACRFPAGTTEVLVRQEGRSVVLDLPDEWSAAFVACLGAWKQPIERPRQTPVGKLPDRFR